MKLCCYQKFLVLTLFGLMFSACSGNGREPEVVVITQEVVVTQEVTVVVVVTATPEPMEVSAGDLESQPVLNETSEWILPEEALAHAGEVVSVRMQQAHCSYREATNGKPTFCNDKPYPGHDFTFVIWGKDWSAHDGACLFVEGEVEVYDGKAQIEVEDQEQVKLCP